MLYFKHTELVNKYHVSLKTVHNWIDAAKNGKLDLDLYDKNGRYYIVNIPKNAALLNQLVEQGKKYRNVRYKKTVTPTQKFYELYSRQQILDIITNLDTHREIPRHYNYFDGGAEIWDKYARYMEDESKPNMLKGSVSLLKDSMEEIDRLTQDSERVNLIDIGPGNGVPTKELLAHLLERGILHRYIAIDISEAMLEIVEKNVKEWFGGRVPFEGHVKDVTFERFDDLIIDDMLDVSADKTVNLALLLGATPMNYPEPYDMLKVIRKSLGRNDLLVYTDTQHTESERATLDVNADINANASALSPKYSFILELMGIDKTLYDTELGSDVGRRISYICVKPKASITVSFKFGNIEREVHVDKGDGILLWRAWFQTGLEIISGFEKAGLTLLYSKVTHDRQHLLTISGVDAKPDAKHSY